MKKIFFVILAVIIVILVFSLGSFGVEADAVMSGYETTRRYAQNSKMMTVAVDTYKAEVQRQVELEEKLEQREPSDVSTLGSYGNVLSKEEYEKYTEPLVIAKAGSFPYTNYYHDSDVTLTEDKSVAASFDKVLHYLTDTDTSPANGGTEIGLYSALQCAAFADWYVNQVSYRDIVKEADNCVVYGAATVVASVLPIYEEGTYWKSNISSGINLYNDPDGLKKFFEKVTPGTFVREVGFGHSYIILGADEEKMIIYDCNTNGDKYGRDAILLHELPWSQVAANSHYSSGIGYIISPPNTGLPNGCFNTQDGTIVNAKEAS